MLKIIFKGRDVPGIFQHVIKMMELILENPPEMHPNPDGGLHPLEQMGAYFGVEAIVPSG